MIITVKLLRVILIMAGFVVALSACVYDPHYYGPREHRYYPYYYPYYYDYYYYPGISVYYQFSTGFYFYFTGNRWIRTKVLPPHIHLNPWDRVKIRVDSDKPYFKHKEHVQRYHPKPRPPEYRVTPKITKPAPGTPIWDKSKRPPVTRPIPRDTKPGTTVWDKSKKSPVTRSDQRVTKPGYPPVKRQKPPVSRNERERNLEIFREHQKKQKEYEKEWEKRNKVYRH